MTLAKAEQIYYGMLRYAPYAAIALLPVYALLLQLSFVGSARRYPGRGVMRRTWCSPRTAMRSCSSPECSMQWPRSSCARRCFADLHLPARCYRGGWLGGMACRRGPVSAIE